MLEDAHERLLALSKVANELNRVSDEFSQRLRDIEARIESLNLGVTVYLDEPLDEITITGSLGEAGEDGVSGDQYFLGYGRFGGRWRILVQTYHSVWPDTEEDDATPGGDFEECREYVDEKPLLDSSRDIRLAAVAQIGRLLEQIEREAKSRIETLRAALRTGVVAGNALDSAVSQEQRGEVSGKKEDTQTGAVSSQSSPRRRSMTHPEQIMAAVADLTGAQDSKEFSRDDVRRRIGVERDAWMSGYTAVFQGMRCDHPGGAPGVSERFKAVFRNVRRGQYVLTPKGKGLASEFLK
jgi:hypothetical protein